nr:RNA-directed DNA polymerase, eukaryota [Tanacetum cinerariifolium]
MQEIINKSLKIIIKGKVHWIRAKELHAWIPNFVSAKDSYNSDDVPDAPDEEHKFGDNEFDKPIDDGDVEKEPPHSSDPFNIYEMLQKKNGKLPLLKASDPIYPPGFTPVSENINKGEGSGSSINQEKSIPEKKQYPSHNMEASSQRTTSIPINEGFILEVMDDLVKVGHTMGYNMEGDFNEVRSEQERFGSSFNSQGANAFNNFIAMSGLINLPLGGYSYTWAHKSASKMSKLDRFLISEGLMVLFPHLSGLCLDRKLYDHRPIIMCKLNLDYGPTPFCIFHSWFNLEGFDSFVEYLWHSLNITYSNALTRLKRKFKLLKNEIKSWVKQNKKKINEAKSSVNRKLTELDKIIDQGGGNEEFVNQRASLLKDLNDINSIEVSELSQKAKVRWFIEGDENSKYFHGILNSKRSQLAIRGIHLDGDWIANPNKIPNRLNLKQVEELECFTSYDEIQRRFGIVRSMSSLPLTAFVSNHQILDGPFILNELLSWCKFKKVNAMIFEVDFEKAFDSVRWDCLADMLKSFVFGGKWRSWISGISINSLAISHLFYADDAVFVGKWDISNINTIVHVLKCFFLAFGLKINIHKSMLMGIGVCKEGITNAASIIGCATFSSPFNYIGVKVGAAMSGINSCNEVIDKISSRLSKWKLKTLSIGGLLTLIKSVLTATPLYRMSLYKAPIRILNRMESSKRDFFNGIYSSKKKIAWVGWEIFLSSKKNEVLGVSSFYAINRGLLFKWVWRFITQDASLWYRLIKAIHGVRRVTDNHSSLRELLIGQTWFVISSLLTVKVLRLICRWWELEVPSLNSYIDWLNWLSNTRLSKLVKEILEGTCYVSWKSRMVKGLNGIASVTIIDRQLPFEYTIASRSTDVRVWNAVFDAHNEELKSMFENQVGVERFGLIQTFYACKQEEGKLVGPYVIKMKSYVVQLERLGYVLLRDLSVGLIMNGLTSDFVGFVRNYNKHNMGKTIGELHALLIEYEKGLL